MAPYNFEEERKKISEYENRTDPAERRGPTQKFEIPEQEGWAQKVREHRDELTVVKCGLFNEQLKRLSNTQISDQQYSWHTANDTLISESEMQVDDEGDGLMLYLKHGSSLPWDKAAAQKIAERLESSTNLFIKHYPPNLPDKDRRFKEEFDNDKKRCKDCGYKIGVHHLILRR